MQSGKSLRLTVGAAALISSLVLTGCTAEDGSGSEEPIRIGAVSSITGPVPFSEIPAAAEAVFERVNDDGGIDGRMIEFISEDDGGDASNASQAAQRLVLEEEVVAFAGSSSMVECSANAATYAQNDVVSITGAAVEPTCFESANIAPVNAGSLAGYETLLDFAAEDLESSEICAVIQQVPSLTEAYLDLLENWENETGNELALIDTSVTHGEDPTPAILAAESAGCDAVAFNSDEPVAASVMNAAAQQGVLEDIDWLTLSAAYTETALDVFNEQDTPGLYVNSEFIPFTSDAPELDGWRQTLTDADVPLTSLSQGGYVSAEILVEVLRGIEGEITRESVTEAFRDLDELEHPLMGTPFSFGTAEAHNPNRASQMVQATEDGWEVVSDWIRLD